MSHLIEKTRGVNGTNLQKEMEVGERDKESRELFSYESLVQDGRFISFVELIRSEGEVLFTEAGREYVVLKPSDFENIDQRIGFCLFANLCFGTDMGFAGTNVIDRNEGRVKVMMEGGTPVAFLGEKKVEESISHDGQWHPNYLDAHEWWRERWQTIFPDAEAWKMKFFHK